MKIRPVDDFDLTLSQSSPDEIEKRIGSLAQPVLLNKEGSEVWNVAIAIHEQDAPLSDSLVLVVTTNTGKQIARFSGHL